MSRVRIGKDETTDLLASLVRIPSINPPGDEGELAHFIHDWSDANGLDAELDERIPGRPNVYVSLRGSRGAPRLLLNGHMDVVPEGRGWKHAPFGAQIERGRLYGRGSADMKAGIAAALVAARALARSGSSLIGGLIVAAVIDEEGPGRGTTQALDRGIKADHAIVCEPTSLGVVVASKGDLDVEITISGKAAHSSVPHEGVNAIYKMTRVIRELERYSRSFKTKHPLLGHPTASVDVIEGGISPWIVPETCRIIVDRRVLPGESLASVRKELAEVIAKAKGDDPELLVEFKTLQFDTPAEISREEEIVKVVGDEYRRATRKQPRIEGLSGTTDARFLINEAKIPTVIFGPGNLSQAHKPDEYVSVAEVHTAAQVYASVASRLLS